VRALIRQFDAMLRRAYGVFEFCDDENCLLRLRLTEAPYPLRLSDHVVRAGDPVLELHLWNEHIPPLPPDGPDLAWATRMRRMLIHSFHVLARYMENDPHLSSVCAVGGVTVLLSPGDRPGGERLMERLGFTITPYHNPLGRFGEFWENFYAWWLMWTFNAASLRRRQLIRLRRVEVWMSADEFLQRYGTSMAGTHNARRPRPWGDVVKAPPEDGLAEQGEGRALAERKISILLSALVNMHFTWTQMMIILSSMYAIVCLMLVLIAIACAPVGQPASVPQPTIASTATVPLITSVSPVPMDPETIAAHLTPVATLDQAARQLARLLGTTLSAVRARIEPPFKPGACMSCDKPPVDASESELKGVPIREVHQPIAPGSAVWLTVQNIVCLYVYDGQELKPASVYVAPH